MRSLLLVLALSQVGCATIYTAFVDENDEDIYGGTRLDTLVVANWVTAGKVACTLPQCEERAWLYVTGAFSDLPLSLVCDTLLLPYTVAATVID